MNFFKKIDLKVKAFVLLGICLSYGLSLHGMKAHGRRTLSKTPRETVVLPPYVQVFPANVKMPASRAIQANEKLFALTLQDMMPPAHQLFRLVQRNVSVEIVKDLIKDEAQSTIYDEHGNTPLHWAVKNHNPIVIILLLQNNANPNALNKNKQTPFDFLLSHKHFFRPDDFRPIYSEFIKYGAIPTPTPKSIDMKEMSIPGECNRTPTPKPTPEPAPERQYNTEEDSPQLRIRDVNPKNLETIDSGDKICTCILL